MNEFLTLSFEAIFICVWLSTYKATGQAAVRSPEACSPWSTAGVLKRRATITFFTSHSQGNPDCVSWEEGKNEAKKFQVLKLFKYKTRRAGEMAQWSRALAVLQRTWVWCPGPLSGSSQLSVALARRGPMPLPSTGKDTHVHIPKCRHETRHDLK